MKSRVCRESQGDDRTCVENSLEKSPLAMEDSGYSTHTPGGGTSVEDTLQSTVLSVTSDQHSDSLSTSSAPDVSAEQSLVPRETSPAPGLPEGSTVPYSNGILKEDGPDLSQECSSAPGTDGDHSEGKGLENPPAKHMVNKHCWGALCRCETCSCQWFLVTSRKPWVLTPVYALLLTGR